MTAPDETVTRAPLSTARVLRAAIAHADTAGLASLSMRKLARELGFEVMSLYNHVANKDEILDGILDLVAAEIEPPPAIANWKASISHSVNSAHDVLLRHPWAAGLWWNRRAGPARMAYMESLLKSLRQAGFPPEIAYHGYHAVLMHILGFTVQELDLIDGERNEMVAAFLQQITGPNYPYLAEHVRQHLDETGHDNDFEYVLNLILDGLDRARDESPARPPNWA